MAKILISGDFRVSPEASDVIFRSSARRCAKENVGKHGAKHSPLLMFFPHVWWPSGLESEVLRVHMYLHVNLKF